MPEKTSVTVPLTARQKEQIKKMTGQTISALKVESAGGATLAKKANILAGRSLARTLTAKSLSKRMAPRQVARAIAPRSLAKTIAPRALAKTIAPRSLARTITAKVIS